MLGRRVLRRTLPRRTPSHKLWRVTFRNQFQIVAHKGYAALQCRSHRIGYMQSMV